MELIFDICKKGNEEYQIYSPKNGLKKKFVVIGSPSLICLERMKKYENHQIKYLFSELSEIEEEENEKIGLSELKNKYHQFGFKWDEEIKENWREKKDEKSYFEKLEKFVQIRLFKEFYLTSGVCTVVIVSKETPCKFLSAMILDSKKRFQKIKLIPFQNQNKNQNYSIHKRILKSYNQKEIVCVLGTL